MKNKRKRMKIGERKGKIKVREGKYEKENENWRKTRQIGKRVGK